MNLSSIVAKDSLLSRPSISAIQFYLALCVTLLSAALLFNGSAWGNNAAYIRANSPADVLPDEKRAWKQHMYIGAATKDQPYYTAARQFVQELAQLHIAYHFDVQHGYHAWNVWQT
jgi:hypothetical protein